MKLKEYTKSPVQGLFFTEWVYVGQWTDLSEDEIQPLVEEWLTDTNRLVLTDDEDDYIKEYEK